MLDWDLIPFVGEKSVRKRLREIDKELVSLLVIIGIGFSKVFEGFVNIMIRNYPISVIGLDMSAVFWWSMYTLFWMLLFILEADQVVREGVGRVADKAEEVKEEIEEDTGD